MIKKPLTNITLMKKKYLTLLPAIPAIAALAPLQSSAQAQLEPSLAKISEKVDTDGTYLQLNKFDGDITAFVEYGELLLDMLRKEEPGKIPAALKVADLVNILGIDALKASALSSKKTNGAWDTKSYASTSSSDKGVLSIYGKANQDYRVTSFAPETTDVAAQIRLDLSKLEPMILSFGEALGLQETVVDELKKNRQEIGGMPISDLISKLDIAINLAIDMDRKERMQIPGLPSTIPNTDLVARIDGLNWAWDLYGDLLIAQSGLPWQKADKEGITTLTLPAEMKEGLLGYSPTIQIDKANNYIWIASKESGLSSALDANSKKLKDGKAFQASMASLPTKGNSLLYLSTDLLGEVAEQYKNADKKGLLQDPEFVKSKPIIDKIIADITSSPSGIVSVLSKDNTGIFSAFRGPLPLKNYLNQLSPMLSSTLPLYMGISTPHISEEFHEIEEINPNTQ